MVVNVGPNDSGPGGLEIIGDNNQVGPSVPGSYPITVVGKNNQLHEIQVNGQRRISINANVVEVFSNSQVAIDIFGEQIIVRNLHYVNEAEWESRQVSTTATTGHWEVRTNGIAIKISPPDATVLDQFKMTKKGPGQIEIEIPS